MKQVWQTFKRLWGLLKENSGVLSLLAIVIGFLALRFERSKFEYDYGYQAQLVLSGNLLHARKENDLVSNLRVRTITYLRLSDERFTSKNSQYIELKNYYVTVGCPIGYDYRCNVDRIDQKPLRESNVGNLEVLFNETPTKIYPTIICVSSLEYSDPKNQYQKQWYLSEACDPDTYIDVQRHYQVTKEELDEVINSENIIGSIDYSLSGPMGIADPAITRQIINLLIQKRWKERFIEPSLIRWWRTNHYFM
ncbi:MAG: hypothetical protein ABIG34_00895 [Candidatus Peregrinibacteria bacterium]